MANYLGNYNPVMYANEALRQLEKVLGIAGRVYRGYEQERRAFNKGDTIQIRKPGNFTVQNAPSVAQDVVTEKASITLNRWKEVKYKLSDLEIAYTTEQIIEEHIRPAAVAIADEIDTYLATLMYQRTPWFYDLNATPGSVVTDITGVRKVMMDNKVPIIDQANLHFMVNSTMEANLLGMSAFTQHQGAGQTGVDTQRSGWLPPKYGFNFFASQNVQSHTKGTCNDTALALVGDHTKGATTVNLDAVDAGVTGTLVPGDTFVIAGNTQRYSVTATSTASGNAFTGVAITPPLVQDYANDSSVTVRLDDHTANLAWHRNSTALVLVPLPTSGDGKGAQIFVATDPISRLTIRARMWYDPDESSHYTALDVLYGAEVLDPNLMVRACG